MTDTKEQNPTISLTRPSGRLELKKTVDSGVVRQSFSHGRSKSVAVEVKRRGEIDGVEQLARYIERLQLDSSLGEVRGVFVAQSIKPQAKVLAESRGFRWVEVDYDELRGMAPDDLRLF